MTLGGGREKEGGETAQLEGGGRGGDKDGKEEVGVGGEGGGGIGQSRYSHV